MDKSFPREILHPKSHMLGETEKYLWQSIHWKFTRPIILCVHKIVACCIIIIIMYSWTGGYRLELIRDLDCACVCKYLNESVA